MSASELTNIISPAFTEKTVLEILKTKSSFSEIQILDIVINRDQSQKGDSYLSSIVRFKVKGSGKNKSGNIEEFTVPVIVKFFPKNIARQKTFRSADFFKAEIEFYTKVWPEMKKFKLSKIPNEPDEVPLLLAAYCDGKNDFIAFEDLGYHGFRAFGRNDVITKETLSLLLKVVANFHALGLVVKQQNPEFEKIALSIHESYIGEKYRPWYKNFIYKSLVPQLQTAAKQILPSEYHDKIPQLYSGDYYGRLIKNISVQDKFSTVTQGDAWLPNFLAKHDKDGNICSVVFIDFQLARYAPLVNDLLHFLYSGVPEHILAPEWDNLIADYHQYLSSRIEALGGEKNFITLQELHEELNRHPAIGIMMSIESITMSLMKDEEVASLDDLEGENAIPLEDVWVLPEYDRPRNERLAFLIKHSVDKGFIP